ncbi:uncharacterized protein PGTG_12994 [Puccinia graminis f. sp. tritici CRL 75-36-700-3]|uniref:Uncharacterized protein n=1 Tax=Puccinia graminis f. sp. tritici (strain CRL 75-36-700-3 / race SCCL) TaxID=418459 RepID=E3KQN7_PUCGT|nr:uncharacterized protein PGTG_12994 [Puccinia graminis f. sp. tritici CRL 75-36-700-3]EFP86612.1 hypothetical protein PGTG_12994 [Puccinia graminis f. sp. tritici CRL 75-36-700-3]
MVFLPPGTNQTPLSDPTGPNGSGTNHGSSTPGYRRQRSPSDPDDDPSPRQRARTRERASELVNPFLDIDGPDLDEQLPDPDTLDATRPPAENLTVALGAQVLTSGQLAMLAEVSHILSPLSPPPHFDLNQPLPTTIFRPQIPQPEHTTIILSTLAAVLKRLDTLTQQQSARTPLDPAPAANLSLAEQVRMFQFSPEAKEFLRQQARESMMHPDLEAYCEDTRDRGLFRMVLSGIIRQPATYLRAQFPPGFVAQDRLSMNHTHTEAKRQLKNVRHQLRNLLLTGVLTSNAEAPPIPNLTKLARDVWRFLMGTATRLSNEEVDTRVLPLLKIRIAYLRLATLENHFDPLARNVSQWDQIDSQLQANRERTVNFTNSWHKMIYLKDEQLFSTSPALADLDTSLCKCPTDREVLDRMASLGEA